MSIQEIKQISQLGLTAIHKIIVEEGGWQYTNHPVDPDKGTYAGVRFKTFKAFIEKDRGVITPKVFKEMAEDGLIKDIVFRIYDKEYYGKMKLESLPSRMIMPVFSCGVNCGTRKAVKILQKTANELNNGNISLKVDGFNGIKTSDLVHKLSIQIDHENIDKSIDYTSMFRNTFIRNWLHYYCKVVVHDPDDLIFLLGWYNRANKYWAK